MHWAVHLEAPQVLELLLERGANLEIRTEKEKNPERAKIAPSSGKGGGKERGVDEAPLR